MNPRIRIATRASDLALWQARWVAAWLAAAGVATELVEVQTVGDLSDAPLDQLGVGVFVRGVQAALIGGGADLAVHSYKDLPSAGAVGLEIVAVPTRAALHDVLIVQPQVVDAAAGAIPLRSGARIGTGAVRRTSQLLELRPDLACVAIRGNVPTRVAQVREQRLDGVMLAAAGLDRLQLDLDGLVRIDLDPRVFLPAPAQGALALEMRVGDPLQPWVRAIHDAAHHPCVAAERHLLALLDAGCQLALGVLATHTAAGIEVLASFEGKRVRGLAMEPEGAAQAAFDALGSAASTGAS